MRYEIRVGVFRERDGRKVWHIQWREKNWFRRVFGGGWNTFTYAYTPKERDAAVERLKENLGDA